jgi:DNA-binding HxlR family transcriptional regulator
MAREYGQFCGLAHALDLVGSRWALLIVRDLLSGPKRFKDLEEGLTGIPTNVLSGRLRELEESGIVRRHLLPRPSKGVAYELTDYGRELEDALVKLGLWGAKSLGGPKEGDSFSVDSLALALRGAFHPEDAAGVSRIYELQLNGKSLTISVQTGQASFVSKSGHSDLGLGTTPETFVALLRGQLRVEDAAATGQLNVSGSKAEARRFFKIFRLPPEPAARSG